MGAAGALLCVAGAALGGPVVATDAVSAAEQAAFLTRVAAKRAAATCYPSNLTPEEMDRLIRLNGLLPPTLLFGGDDRWWVDTIAWSGDLGQGASGQAAKAHFTYSFPADGVTWGLASISATGPNDLNSKFDALFGAANRDRGRELLRQCYANWRKYCGVTYDEVADDGVPMDQVTARQATRGDLRVGGRAFGTGSFLAYDAFPSASGLAGVGGSDMCINTSFFLAANFNDATNNYRYFRDTCTHEHGHGLGCIHSVPCNNTKLMEPFISTAFDAVQIDDRRGGGRNYGDRYSGNQSSATAKDLGNLTSQSFIGKNLSTNGVAGPNGTAQDWFKFTLSSPMATTISAAPTGGTYTAGQQSSSCSGTTAAINASAAGNLNIDLVASDGSTVLQTAAAAAAGSTETLSAGTLAAGTYYARVYDVGPNAAANQTVQLYDLTIRTGSTKAPPLAIAGVGKRIAVNTNCFFMGDISSEVTETGATISAYAWDLDANGTFETAGAQPNRQYVSNGNYPITLRVTDSNGMSSTDTINLVVFGATASLTNCSPANGNQGATVPVTLTGVNLKSVLNASQVTVSGSGVSVIGTPVPDSLGTTVTGLSFQIAGGAATGLRSVSVTNSDGSGGASGNATLNSAFLVQTPPGPPGAFSLSLPSNGATNQSLTPALSWGSSSGAATYTVTVANDAGLSSVVLTQGGLVGTSFNVPGGSLNYSQTYFWGVTAVNGNGSTVSTPASFSFTTSPPPPPGAFNLLTPANGSTNVGLTPTLTWSAASGATSYLATVATDPGLSVIVVSQAGIGGTSYNVPAATLSAGQTYYWGVTAVNGGGGTGSTPASFSFQTVPPACTGDINGDGQRNTADLTILLGSFGTAVPPGTLGDLDGNGFVNTADLLILLGVFGVPC